jgi:hypothetical protein
MSLETEVSGLTTSTTALLSAVVSQQTIVNAAVLAFTATTYTVANELNYVENTTDLDKVISTAATAALLTKQATLVDGVNISTVNGVSLLGGTPLVVARGQVEIPILSYANRADLRTPILPIPLSGDVVTIAHLGHFQYSSTFEFVDDDEMVFEAIDPVDGDNPGNPIGQWVLTIPAYEWTEAQKMFENALLWEWMEDEQLRFNTY